MYQRQAMCGALVVGCNKTSCELMSHRAVIIRADAFTVKQSPMPCIKLLSAGVILLAQHWANFLGITLPSLQKFPHSLAKASWLILRRKKF